MTEEGMIKSIGIIGGTGKEGKGLAYRWSKAGYQILIGSRQAEKASMAANELLGLLGPDAIIEGLENPAVAERADLLVLTVPYSAHQATLDQLKKRYRVKFWWM